jgi:DNA-binding transcriptional MerR regulator/mannose-6-phosphate isomerase-like protein (cupin superfamily)
MGMDRESLNNGSYEYAIGEASRAVGVAPGTLRLWESEGLVKPSRSKGGTRYYSKGDVQRLRRIKQLKSLHRLNSAAVLRELGPADPPPFEDGQKDKKPAKGVGERLRQLRVRHRMTLRGLAKATGLSASFLSALERGESGASIASLTSIARVYGLNVRDIFGAELENTSPLVRPGDRPVMQWPNGVRYEELAASGSLMNPSFVYVPPNAGSGGFYSHAGEEFVYVLSGSFHVELKNQETYRLEAEDVLYFPSTTPHRWWTEGEEARVIYVNTPPTF